jgi:hypothetical protein
MAVQQGHRRSKNRRCTLQGYVEDSCEPRTLLATFFSILLVEQDDVEKRAANADSAVVIDKSKLSELIQEKTDS